MNRTSPTDAKRRATTLPTTGNIDNLLIPEFITRPWQAVGVQRDVGGQDDALN